METRDGQSDSGAAALAIEGLRFRYGGGEGWSLEIPRLLLAAGEQTLLTGGSGRGKSTLLHLIAGLIEPGEGRVLIEGQEMHALRGAKRDLFRGDRIGMIFQTFHLLPGFSALENVMLAMTFSRIAEKEHRERAQRLLERLGIERTHAAPEELSVGQQQRVAVARAVACDPALVLADEPTASLDPEAGAAAMDLIQEVCKERGAALLCVSHDPALPARFERVLSLDELSAGRNLAV